MARPARKERRPPWGRTGLLAGLALAAARAAAFEPGTSPPHFALTMELGGGNLLVPPPLWSGGCRGHGSPTANCPGQLLASDTAPGAALAPGTTGVGEIGFGFGGAVGLTSWLTLQFGSDLMLGVGSAGPSPPLAASPSGSSFSFGPGTVWDLLFDLPIDLRFRLGPRWDLYGGAAPGVALAGLSQATLTTPSSGSRTGGMEGNWIGVLWRAGFDRFFSYRRSALGVLAEAGAGGQIGLFLTYTFHSGDAFEVVP